jgi:Ca-activated chloride channel family protein
MSRLIMPRKLGSSSRRSASLFNVTTAAMLLAVSGLVSPGLAQRSQQVQTTQIDAVHPHVIVPQRPWTPTPGQTVPVPVRAASIDVDIEILGSVARTTMAIELRNHTGRPAETEMLIPVPDGAAITSFGLDGLTERSGGETTAVLLPKDEARQVYTDIVRRMVDPGLLEFVGHGMIRSSVFPVPANSSETFRVTYEEVLTGHGPRKDYILLKPEGSVGLSAEGPAWDIDIGITAPPRAGGLPIAAVWSPSHGIVTTLNGPHASVDVTNPESPGSFRMSVLRKRSDAPMTVIAYPDPDANKDDAGSGYFALLMPAPELPEGTEPMPREVTLVLDRSGSMSDGKLDQAIDAALQVIGALRDGERFNLVDYSSDVRTFATRPVAKTPESFTQLRAYLESLRAMGGTNIHDALLTALQPEPTEGHLPIVLFLTDGQATEGVTSETGIRDAVAKANTHTHRVYSFGVGYNVNAPLLSGLAQTTRAAATFVTPDENIETKVGDLFAKLDGPVLASPVFKAGPVWGDHATPRVFDVLPSPDGMPDIFAGDQVVIVGRYRAAEVIAINIIGDRLGERADFRITFNPASDASPAASYVPRLWAQRQIGALTDRIQQLQAETEPSEATQALILELTNDVIALSQQFGILTEYTAFLAAEDEDLRRLAAAGQLGGGGQGPFTETMSLNDLQMLNYQRTGAAPEPAARSGAAAVERARQTAGRNDNQQMEAADAVVGTQVLAKLNDAGTQRRAVDNVQRVAGQSFIQRSNRWIDGRVLESERQVVLAYTEAVEQARADNTPEPEAPVLIADQAAEAFDQVLEFGTDAYDALLDRFINEGRQSVLAVPGELVLLLDGHTVLVRNPG